MKPLIGIASAIVLVSAGVIAALSVHPVAPREKPPEAIAHPDPPGEPQAIPIPETMITLKQPLQWKDDAGAPGIVLEAGAQLVTESTQGLDYIVSRDGRSFRIRCDDAYEGHGRFTNGEAEQLAVQMAAEIRAGNKVPTNERIVSRAYEALDQRRLNASFSDPASVVDSLQRTLLLTPSADLDGEIPLAPSGKPD